MKSFLYTLVAVAAISLGGAFTSTASAQHGHRGGHHHGHNHGRSHFNHGHSHFNHGHSHHHHNNFYRGGYGGYGYGGYGYNAYRPVYPYYQQGGMYYRGSNFGIRIGF